MEQEQLKYNAIPMYANGMTFTCISSFKFILELFIDTD